MGDDLSNRLIVTGTGSHMKVIEDVAKQLQEAGEGSARQIQVVSLKHIAALPVARMISQLFTQQVASTDAGQKLVVSASPDDRTLLVDANAPTLNRINQLIQVIDTPEAEGQAVIQTVHLKKAVADTLAEAVTRFAPGVTQDTFGPSFYGSTSAENSYIIEGLNITREPMAKLGFCPSGRLFEAAACGAALISDSWQGLSEFYEPGSEGTRVVTVKGHLLAQLDRCVVVGRADENEADHAKWVAGRASRTTTTRTNPARARYAARRPVQPPSRRRPR